MMASRLVSSKVASLALALLLIGWSPCHLEVAGQVPDDIADPTNNYNNDNYTQTAVRRLEEKLVCDKAEKEGFACAVCFVDVGKATFFLGQAALAIRSSVHLCQKDYDPTKNLTQLKWTKDEKTKCTVATATAVAFISFVASFTANAASDCARTLNVNGYCASDITGITARLGILVAASSSMKLNCRPQYSKDRPRPTLEALINTTIRDHKVDRAAHKHHRRLVEVARLPPSEIMFPHWTDRHLDVAADYQKVKSWSRDVANRRADLAACAFNIGQAVMFLMAALLSITASSRSCTAPKIAKEGVPGQMVCAVDVTAIILSFSATSAFIAFAVTSCPIGTNIQAQCAGDISAAVSAISGIASSGARLGLSCGRVGKLSATGEFIGNARRLRNANLREGQARQGNLREYNDTGATSEGRQRALEEVDSMAESLARLILKPSNPVLELIEEFVHPDFRCILTSEPPSNLQGPMWQMVPEAILQKCIKIADEAPTDLKSNLRRSYAKFSQESIEACLKPREYKATLFALCFFHALILGRIKFGPQGWSKKYPFNDGDLTICAQVLCNYLNNAERIGSEVPWPDLRYIFGEIMYGGHITDFWDRRVCTTYLATLVLPDLLNNLTLAPGFKSPDASKMES
ncbi:unnamed protein product, partial [Polarella glacialis]